MAILDLEFTDETFRRLVWALVASQPAVPFPTLDALGDDRLISAVEWPTIPQLEESPPTGVEVHPGELLYRIEIRLTHVSVAELVATPSATGMPEGGEAWFRVGSSNAGMRIDFVAYRLNPRNVQTLRYVQQFGMVALPGLPVPVVRTAVVQDGTSVALRLATITAENLLQGPGGFLAARRAAGSLTNWGLHVPDALFVELVKTQIGGTLSDLGPDTSVEDQLTTTWELQSDGAWGVSAAVGLLKKDACPGIFGSVNLSVGLQANASFSVRTENPPLPDGTTDTKHYLDVRMVIDSNASDWDSFRCWLGSGAVLGGFVGVIVNPFLGIGVGMWKLVAIGDEISDGAVKPLHEKSNIGPLKKISDTDDGAIYAQTIELPSKLLKPGEEFLEIGASGMDLFGTVTLLAPTHAVAFNPDGGNLKGVNFSSLINCSQRSLDWTFTFGPVTVTDKLMIGNTSIDLSPPTYPYPFSTTTSNVLGTGTPLVDADKSTFRIRGGAMRPGGVAWIVLHTSAGVRFYTLGPVPSLPETPDIQRLIDKRCDALHEMVAVIVVDQLKFEAPEPAFEYGFDALKQWQLVLGDLRDGNDVVVAVDGREVLSSARLAIENGRAVGQVVINADSELSVRTEGEQFGLAAAHRWLVPFQQLDLPSAALGLTQAQDGVVVVHTASDGAFRVNPATYALTPLSSSSPSIEQYRRKEPALAVSAAVVAAVHGGRLLMTFPAQTHLTDIPAG